MSIASTVADVEYPESDGMPMGETDLHINWMIRLRALMLERYRAQNAYVASNLLVYYQQGVPSKFVVPDVFVVLDHPPGMRRTYKIWEEGRAPDVVIEVTSKSTRREDETLKPNVYAMIGVGEYFLYDPTAEYLHPALIGYRLDGGAYRAIQPNDQGQLPSTRLGITLALQDDDLVLRDAKSGAILLTSEEAADQRSRDAEKRQHDAEKRRHDAEKHRYDAELRQQDAELRQRDAELRQIEAEKRQREAEQNRAQAERELEASMEENAALTAEIARLRRRLDDKPGAD